MLYVKLNCTPATILFWCFFVLGPKTDLPISRLSVHGLNSMSHKCLHAYLPSLVCRSLSRRLELELRPSISCTDEARLLLHTLSLEMDCVRQVVDRAWDRLGRSHSCLGDEWSRGPDTLIGDEWGLELIRACVSLASAGLLLSLVGDWNSLKGTESLLALGESTITVSGSSWGRDCLLDPKRFKEGRRNLKNRPFPGGDERERYRRYQEPQLAHLV